MAKKKIMYDDELKKKILEARENGDFKAEFLFTIELEAWRGY